MHIEYNRREEQFEMLDGGMFITAANNQSDLTAEMTTPVRCTHCGGVYDLAKVKGTNLPDCTLYQTPCCNKAVDDREYVSLPAFRRL